MFGVVSIRSTSFRANPFRSAPRGTASLRSAWSTIVASVMAFATLLLPSVALLVVVGSPVNAHEGIASSDPASGAVLDDPIEAVTIDFGADIGTAVEIGIVGPDGEVPSTTTVRSTTEAVAAFELLEERGSYTVNYLATSVVDGHLIGGSFSFAYGQPSSDVMSPLLFGVIALVILSVGAWFSWRAHVRQRDAELDDPEIDGAARDGAETVESG